MQLHQFTHNLETGWSQKKLPSLEGDGQLVLVFGAPAYAEMPQALLELTKQYPKAVIIGCSTAGEIEGATVHDSSLSVAAIGFKKTKVRLATAKLDEIKMSKNTGTQIAKQLKQKDLRGVFVISDGLLVNGSELVRGLNGELDKNVVVTGGLAGDGQKFKSTWIFAEGKVSKGIVAAVGLYGDAIQIGHGSDGGWNIFGPERKVTKSIGNVLYELDGEPALDLYKKYLGDLAKGLPANALLFPLSLRAENDNKSLVRTILAVDEKNKSMTFAGDIPEGHCARLMRASPDNLVDGAVDAAKMIRFPNTHTSPTLAVAISCVGRRLVLGTHIDEEPEATLKTLPTGTKQVGFYSYGEISPHAEGEFCDLHNQTMTITTFYEK